MKKSYFKFIVIFLAIILIAIVIAVPSFKTAAKNVLSKSGSFMANIIASAADVFDGNSGLKQAGQISLDDYVNEQNLNNDSNNSTSDTKSVKTVAKSSSQDETAILKQQVRDLKKEISLMKENKSVDQDEDVVVDDSNNDNNPTSTEVVKSSIKSTSSKNDVFCGFNSASGSQPKHTGVVFNEIAWMGSTRSSSDEWMELKNISGSEVDLTDWQIIAKDGGIKINLSGLKNTKISSGKFTLLERTDDYSVLDVAADLIYKGGLTNSNEDIKLFDNNCNLIDEVSAGTKWPAGDNKTKQTMERNATASGAQLDFGWHTSANAGGTPKQENSPVVVSYSGGGGGVSAAASHQSESGAENNNAPQFYALSINEIMYDATSSDEGREWVEVLNSGSSTIDLAVLKFFEGDVNHGLILKQGEKDLPPGEYAILANDFDTFHEDYPNYSGIIFESPFSLKNDGELIVLKSGDLQIDQVNYISDWGANGNGNSLQLFTEASSSQMIWKESIPTPGVENVFISAADNNSNSTSTSFDGENSTSTFDNATSTFDNATSTDSGVTSTPIIINANFTFSPLVPMPGEEVKFNAASSVISGGEISQYEWQFGDGGIATSTNATTTHIYSTTGDYEIKLIVYGGNISSTVTSTILISLVPVDNTTSTTGSGSTATSTTGQNSNLLADHVVISEIYPDKTGDNFDFIELYNPTGSVTDLANYSLKLQKGSAIITSSLASFSTGNSISAKKFFLVGLDQYKNSSNLQADITRSYSLPTTASATIFLMNGDEIIDSFGYDSVNIVSGQSFERKAYTDGLCVSAQGDGELLGNGCDTDDYVVDFENRINPNPQNSLSDAEPVDLVNFNLTNASSTSATSTNI